MTERENRRNTRHIGRDDPLTDIRLEEVSGGNIAMYTVRPEQEHDDLRGLMDARTARIIGEFGEEML